MVLSDISLMTHSTPTLNKATGTRATVSNNQDIVQDPVNTGGDDNSTVSALSRQLSEAASRAEARDASLSRKELSDLAWSIKEKIGGDYIATKARYDAEVPQTDDPELLARAKQATEYINGVVTDGRGKNPFSGMPRDQLNLIIYDDSGAFTVNERRSAQHEVAQQEQAWRQVVIAKGTMEYSNTGKMTDFYKNVLEHYRGLPAIEQSQYPADYEARLLLDIAMDLSTEVPDIDSESFWNELFKGDTSLAGKPTASTEEKVAVNTDIKEP
ncbi:hypothetical protein [Pseudomonas sp. D1-1]|uniref:hypothetical protein n=1 Tax=Pseudomonas sp. D1-1 TaxID=1040793 RepID=UPI003DA9D726